MHPSLTIYSNSVFDFIRKDFEIKLLSSGFQFTEGPVWNQDEYFLFSDIPANRIYRISTDGRQEIFLEKTGTENPDDPDLRSDQSGSNALAYDAKGNLWICRHGSHDLAIYDGRAIKSTINQFEGRPFNSPNDLVVHADGRIYFSDPPYGLKDGKPNPDKFQKASRVYCWQDGRIEVVSESYQYPNGVCLSPDQKLLYLCSNKPFEQFVCLFDTGNNRFIKYFAEENSDGIKCDREGNVYLCNKDGIIILNRNGERMALIELNTVPANCCWGGEGMNDLFVTARENVFLIQGLQR